MWKRNICPKIGLIDSLVLSALGLPLSYAGSLRLQDEGGSGIRGLSTDRPDTTESAFTVPKGLFQVEATVFGYSRDRAEGVLTETFTWGGFNLKYGIADRTDIQVVFDAYTIERDRDRSPRESRDGFSDVSVRLKQNIRGNNESGLAVALMPFVKIPTDTRLSNREWEGGLIIPFGLEISKWLTVNWMLEGDAIYISDKDRHEAVFVHTISLAWILEKVSPGLGLFTEFAGEAGGGPYRASANAGFTYGVSDDLQLDVALNLGVTEAAEDFACFTGISFRF